VPHLAILRFCAPRPPPIQLPTSPTEALNASSSRLPPAHSRDHIHAHTPKVDLGIAKVSLVLQATFFVLIAVSKDAVVFVTMGALGALAMGYPPTVQSLSLELYTRRGGAPSESGRLFGAMSVIQTIGYVVPPEVLCEVGLTLTLDCGAGTRLSAQRCLASYTSRRSPRSPKRFSTSL